MNKLAAIQVDFGTQRYRGKNRLRKVLQGPIVTVPLLLGA